MILTFLQIDCSEGYFGIGCIERCGHCVNLTQCHNVYGTCLSDCEAGFKGEYCREGVH